MYCICVYIYIHVHVYDCMERYRRRYRYRHDGYFQISRFRSLGSHCLKTKKHQKTIRHSARIQDTVLKVISGLPHGLNHLQDHWFLAIDAVGDALKPESRGRGHSSAQISHSIQCVLVFGSYSNCNTNIILILVKIWTCGFLCSTVKTAISLCRSFGPKPVAPLISNTVYGTMLKPCLDIFSNDLSRSQVMSTSRNKLVCKASFLGGAEPVHSKSLLLMNFDPFQKPQ